MSGDSHDYTRRLATFAATLRYEDIPRDVREHAKLCLLDTLGCGLFGSTLPWSRILADTVTEFEREGPSTMWGLSATLSPLGAALVNGTMTHGFEMDDLHKSSIVHPGAVVAPAIFAMLSSTRRQSMVTTRELSASSASSPMSPN